jgi:HEAT repeat protein
MLSDPNPRRRQDASYALGHLHSTAGIDQHIALLQWDPANATKSDWPMIAQAAESLGWLGDPRSVELLMQLVKPAPEAAIALPRPQRDEMAQAIANALVALARLHHHPAMQPAVHILQTDPGECPHAMRWAAAFAIGMLGEQGGTERQAERLQRVYESMYEDLETKFEALKGLGNLGHVPAADRLKEIGETDATPELRWIAHWAYERTSGKTTPYTSPSEKREPPVSITDLAR